MNRREFLKGTAWMGAAAFAVGCTGTRGFGFGEGGLMATYADKPFKKLRVGIIGLGRGGAGFPFAAIPGCEITAVCDLDEKRIQDAMQGIEKRRSQCERSSQKSMPKVYTGSPEAWKRLCDDSNVDVVMNSTPWELHVPVALYAMRAGKHVLVEVPSAFTVDECWELVETSEKLRRHCMQLENCCYGEAEMLAMNLVRLGLLGDIVHAEGAYIHDLRSHNYGDWNKDTYAYWDFWRLKHNIKHKGNQYPTHGLGPVAMMMNINRGDKFDYLVSLESNQANFEAYAKAAYPEASWKHSQKVDMGDMNTMLIKTHLGRSIMVQHDVSSPRPYSRINRITGTKGIFEGIAFCSELGHVRNGCPVRLGWESKPGQGLHRFFNHEQVTEIREKYKHPLYKQSGELAKQMGGHGGMDFMMILRVAYCLQNGLPLDQNVYDLASWCCLCELSEKSVRARSKSVDIPDFTRGAWRTTPPLEIGAVDIDKLGIN